MSPQVFCAARPCVCFPRVSGDEPVNAVSGGTKDTFSPRERG